MDHQITHNPSFALLEVNIQPGELLVAEAGSMVAKDSHVGMEVKMNAGAKAGFFDKVKAFFIAFVRKIIGGESFFVNHFSAAQPGRVWVAPTLIGQVAHKKLGGGSFVMSSGAFVASMGDVDMKMKFGGLKSLFSKEGLFMLEVSGTGDVWFNSYGGIEEIEVNGTYILDNGHLVGYEGQLEYSLKKAGGGFISSMTSGEGIVLEFSGQGKIYMQSRNIPSFVGWVANMLP